MGAIYDKIHLDQPNGSPLGCNILTSADCDPAAIVFIVKMFFTVLYSNDIYHGKIKKRKFI